jgi:hypothetical protein
LRFGAALAALLLAASAAHAARPAHADGPGLQDLDLSGIETLDVLGHLDKLAPPASPAPASAPPASAVEAPAPPAVAPSASEPVIAPPSEVAPASDTSPEGASATSVTLPATGTHSGGADRFAAARLAAIAALAGVGCVCLGTRARRDRAR